MGIANCFKEFFSFFITQMSQLFLKTDPQSPPAPPPAPAPAPPSHDLDPEAVAVEHHHQHARPVAGHTNFDWTMIMMAFCLASAIAIATLSVQTHFQLPPNPNFYLFCFAITLAFASLFVSKFIDTKYAVAAHVLDLVGVFFAATAFFVAITIPSPLWVKCISWTIYAISLLAILICNRF